LLCVTQPRVSDLWPGKIELLGLDTLVTMIGAAGYPESTRHLETAYIMMWQRPAERSAGF